MAARTYADRREYLLEYNHKWRAANREKRAEAARIYRLVHPEVAAAAWRKFKDSDPARAKQQMIKATHNATKNVTPAYVAGTLRMPLAEVSEALLELKREQLKTARVLQQLKQTIEVLNETRSSN